VTQLIPRTTREDQGEVEIHPTEDGPILGAFPYCEDVHATPVAALVARRLPADRRGELWLSKQPAVPLPVRQAAGFELLHTGRGVQELSKLPAMLWQRQ
jgi:hypothetical protein